MSVYSDAVMNSISMVAMGNLDRYGTVVTDQVGTVVTDQVGTGNYVHTHSRLDV